MSTDLIKPLILICLILCPIRDVHATVYVASEVLDSQNRLVPVSQFDPNFAAKIKEIGRIARSIGDCNGSDDLEQMIKFLDENPDCEVTIYFTDSANDIKTIFEGNDPRKPMNAAITWASEDSAYVLVNNNADLLEAYSGKSGVRKEKASALIHELAHALNGCLGLLNTVPLDPSDPLAPVADDVYAADMENTYRRNNGCPVRPSYGNYKLPSRVTQDCSSAIGLAKTCSERYYGGNGICIGARNVGEVYRGDLATGLGIPLSEWCFDGREIKPSGGCITGANGQDCYKKQTSGEKFSACPCGQDLCLSDPDNRNSRRECIDVLNDGLNCGGCNARCGPDESCIRGVCIKPNPECFN